MAWRTSSWAASPSEWCEPDAVSRAHGEESRARVRPADAFVKGPVTAVAAPGRSRGHHHRCLNGTNTRGTVTRTAVPPPGASVSTNSPPCASTMRLAVWQSETGASVLGRWKKGSSTRPRNSSGIPGRHPATVRAKRVGAARGRRQFDVALAVHRLRGVEQQVGERPAAVDRCRHR